MILKRVLGWWWLTFLNPVWADDAAAAKLNTELSRIDSAEALFSQHMIDAKGVRGKEFTGHMMVKRPGLFRWDTQKPYAQTIVADGRKVWIYDPDLNQVVVQPLGKQVGNTPALLLSGDLRKMLSGFDITQEESPVTGEESFLLKPTAKDAMFDAMRIKFSKGMIAEMQLKDSLGQKTRIEFSDVKYNANLTASSFRFTPPKGAELIDQ